MSAAVKFGEVVEAADRLTPDEQHALIAILHRRLAESGRQRIVADVVESRQEFAKGSSSPTTPEELMREIMS